MKLFMRAVLVMWLCSGTTVSVFQEPKAYCFKDGTNYQMQFLLIKNDDTVETVYGLSVADPTIEMVETCSTAVEYAPAEITGDGTTATPYTITVNIGAGVMDIECGQRAVGETYTWLFRTGSTVLIQKPSDKIFSVTCPFGTMTENMAASVSLSVTGDLSDTVVNVISESISLLLVDENSNIVINAALGANAKLQLSLSPNNGAKGVYAYSCDAGDMADFSGVTYPLIDADGCTVTLLFVDGFTAVTSSGSTSRTGVFEVFRFRLGASVFYRCRIGYCYGDSDAPCSDYCQHNGKTDLGKRRKRSIDHKPDIIVASYVVTNIPHHVVSTQNGNATLGARCVTDVGVVSGFCILGLLVCLSTTAAIFMFYRLKITTDNVSNTINDNKSEHYT